MKPPLWVARCVVVGMSIMVGTGCGTDPAVDQGMERANEVVNRYCNPIPGELVPNRHDMRDALQSIAERERRSPDSEFRIDDSEDPTTAGALLDDLRQLAEQPRCTTLADDIAHARASARS